MKKRALFISVLTLISVMVFVGVLAHAVWYRPVAQISVPQTGAVVNDPTHYPTKLSIPAINVHADVQLVGITKGGNMAVPNNFVDVGWYRYGSIPGAIGSAVIAGHVDNGLALPGVFKNLDSMKIGDDIYVLLADGEQKHFVVTDIQTYNRTDATNEVFIEHSQRLLRLITCTGNWVSSAHTHDKRLVVTAVLQEHV